MKNEERIIELLSEQIKRQDTLIDEMREMKVEMRGMKTDAHGLTEQQVKTNLAIGELRLSVMKLAEAIEKLNTLENRVHIVEDQLRFLMNR